jgi:hypothetical protein
MVLGAAAAVLVQSSSVELDVPTGPSLIVTDEEKNVRKWRCRECRMAHHSAFFFPFFASRFDGWCSGRFINSARCGW